MYLPHDVGQQSHRWRLRRMLEQDHRVVWYSMRRGWDRAAAMTSAGLSDKQGAYYGANYTE